MPERIQRRRTRGWHIPDGAVNVCRPTKWGNPYAVTHCDAVHERDRHWHVYPWPDARWLSSHPTKAAAVLLAVEWFARDLMAGKLAVSVADVRRELGDKDLVCWCPLDSPCHANVLLTVANCGHCWCDDPETCCYCTPLADGETYAARPCVGDPDGDLPLDDEDGRAVETITTTGGLL